MKTDIQIVDRGRGPQLSTSRLTVMDIFYYLQRGRDWDIVRQALPSLSREEFEVVLDYVNQHRDELVDRDRRVEERIQQGIAAQKAKGLYHEIDESVPVEQRAARLKEKLRHRLHEEAEKTVVTLLVDANLDGHAALLDRRLQTDTWRELRDHLDLRFLDFQGGDWIGPPRMMSSGGCVSSKASTC